MPLANTKEPNPDAIYTAEMVMNIVGLTKNEYNYRRRLIDKHRKKHQRFSEGDIWAYMMVSRYLRARFNASSVAKANWPLIFDACNTVQTSSLEQWKFVYVQESESIDIVAHGDKEPEGEEFYDKLTVYMAQIMNRTNMAFAESRRLKGKRNTGDEFMLARLKRDLAKSVS